MKTTIARRKSREGYVFLPASLIGVFVMVAGLMENDLLFCIVGCAIAVLCLFFFLSFILLPLDIIVLSDDGTILLPKGVVIPLKDIISVDVVRVKRTENMILITERKRYVVEYVEDCENVAKYLNKIVAKAKRK